MTETDLEVDALLHGRLTAARPGYGWLSEESADDSARLCASRTFVVDPIDGTRAFAGGERSWAVALAVVTEGRVTAAAIFLPALGQHYTAALGAGARLNGRQARVSGRAAAEGAKVLASRATFDARHWAGPPPPVERHFRPALAFRAALVAAGRFDGTLTFRDSWEWDIAAGALIAAEAGAAVSDRAGRPLSFNTPGRQTPGLIAAAPGLHAAFLARLA